jgi:BirA family biotin operon repressor/biotin-[acetyl-CoA-carboxylase] ligase
VLLDEVDSTNAYLLRRAGELPDGAVVSAEYQTAGRGRLGRSWVAPRGSSILVSVLLKGGLNAVALESNATMLGALAACEAVESATDCHAEVRWPNDILAGGKKLGGVLAEAGFLAGGRALVLGIGLNCLQQRGHFAGQLADRATSLELQSPGVVSRAAVAAALLARLDAWVASVSTAGDSATLRSTWRGRCADLGRRVTLQHSGTPYSGTVIDITGDGDLEVQLDLGGRRRFGAATTTRCG